MTVVNRQIRLVSRPSGYPKVSDFRLVYSPLPSPGADEVLVRSVYLSLDPHLRGRMSDAESHAPAVAIGEVMTGGAVGLVVESRHPAFRVGDAVEGILGWQEYALAAGGALRKIDPELAPISTALGVLGVPGLTAYFGLLELCHPRRGETLVVSGAAGGVGMIVGQIGKILGCRVVGLAGADSRIEWLLDDLGFDAAINYKTAGDLAEALGKRCPDGIDLYFDNVGGSITDVVVRWINTGARIAVCGQVSQHNLQAVEMGPRWLEQLIVKQAKVEGFLVSAYAQRFPEGLEQLARWLKEGKLKYREEIAQGIEATPQAFIEMLQGRNEGKQLVHFAVS